jgi:hypothetical protein
MTAAEELVKEKARMGQRADLSELSEGDRELSGEFLRHLCLAPHEQVGTLRGIHLSGAHIRGRLDLRQVSVLHPLEFENSTFEMEPSLVQTGLPSIRFIGCALPGLDAREVRTDFSFSLASEVSGRISLRGARIGGDLICTGAKLSSEDGDTLLAEGAQIGGWLLLRRSLTTGTVWLHGAKVGGYLDCSHAVMATGTGPVLVGQGAEIGGWVLLRHGSYKGTIWLHGAKIGGYLDCEGATFASEGRDAIVLQGAEIGGTISLRGTAFTPGTMRLELARIGGELDVKEPSSRLRVDKLSLPTKLR